MPPELILDPATLDMSKVLAGPDAIRANNPQRFEMEHLDAVVHLNTTDHVIVGYKDIRPDEFWVRGHMPQFPLMPGVIMCEASAQLVSFYIIHVGLRGGDFIGFGGMEEVRFRGVVRPGDRLVLMGKGLRVHRRQSTFHCQGFVGSTMVFHANIIGVQLSLSRLTGGEPES
ncbi:MAG: 3-hydroxyacyl-ACP dehydratase FabZ family protein [Gemmataceae bacterium]